MGFVVLVLIAFCLCVQVVLFVVLLLGLSLV